MMWVNYGSKLVYRKPRRLKNPHDELDDQLKCEVLQAHVDEGLKYARKIDYLNR